MKLCIGLASYGDMKVQTALCLAMAIKVTPGELTFSVRRGPYTHWNREALVEDALAQECSHLMFVDTDMTFPRDGFLRLMAQDKDVIGGFYNMKTIPPVATIKMLGEDGKMVEGVQEIPGQSFQCAAIGTGFMLVNLERLQASDFAPPYFYCENGEGEDVYFCRRCRESDLEVWCDPTIELQHLGEYAY